MRLFAITVIASLANSPAIAQCNSANDTFLSCTFSGGRKAVDVCIDGPNITYTFGRIGATPDLHLSVPVTEIEYIPWPGIGRSIFESVTFRNKDIRYVVTGGVDRTYPENENDEIISEIFGIIDVEQGAKTLASLLCDKGSAQYSYGGSIYDAKKAAGQCWDHSAQRWSWCN